MSLSSVEKQEIVKDYQRKEGDTGSPEVQVAIFTKKIEALSEHAKKNPKDKHSRRGLLAYVNKRRKLLDYFKRKSVAKYRDLIQSLGLRR